MIDVLLSAVSLMDSSGSFAGSLAVMTDVTEQKRAEEALRTGRQQYQMLFQTACDGVVLHELVSPGGRGKFIQANDSICRMLGYTPGEICDLTPLDILSSENLFVVPQDQSVMLRDGVLLHEKTLIAKDRRRIDTEIHTRLFEHEGKQMCLSIIRDITERKKAEEALKESQDRFRAVFENAAVGMALVSLSGHILEANDPFCRF